MIKNRRKSLFLPILPVCALLAAGCIGPTDTVESLVWEGSLSPLADASLLVTGSAAIVSSQFNTQIGIGVQSVDSGVVLQWSVRTGDCDAEGEPVANLSLFPPFEVGTSGEGSSGLVLGGRIPSTQSYAAWVGPSTGDTSPVSCAELALRD